LARPDRNISSGPLLGSQPQRQRLVGRIGGIVGRVDPLARGRLGGVRPRIGTNIWLLVTLEAWLRTVYQAPLANESR